MKKIKDNIDYLVLIVYVVVMTIFTAKIANAQEYVAPSKNKVAFVDTTTTYTYKMSDKTYKVFVSKTGAYYVWKVSKRTNKVYKMYLPKDIQIAMGRKYTK